MLSYLQYLLNGSLLMMYTFLFTVTCGFGGFGIAWVSSSGIHVYLGMDHIYMGYILIVRRSSRVRYTNDRIYDLVTSHVRVGVL